MNNSLFPSICVATRAERLRIDHCGNCFFRFLWQGSLCPSILWPEKDFYLTFASPPPPPQHQFLSVACVLPKCTAGIHTHHVDSIIWAFLMRCNFLSYFHFLHPRLSLGWKPSLWGLLLLLVPWCHSRPRAQSQIHTRLQVRGWMLRSSEKRLTSSEEIRKTRRFRHFARERSRVWREATSV